MSQAAPAAPTPAAIQARLDEALKDWRAVLRRHAPLARQMLRKVIRGRVVVTPEARDAEAGYRIRGKATIAPLLSVELRQAGVPVLTSEFQNREERGPLDAQGMASPSGVALLGLASLTPRLLWRLRLAA
jgi:hypothetical protein